MRAKLKNGFEFEVCSGMLASPSVERALELLDDEGNANPFTTARELFCCLVDAGCSKEVAEEVKKQATFDDTNLINLLIRVVLGGGVPEEETDRSMPKNSDAPAAIADGCGQE